MCNFCRSPWRAWMQCLRFNEMSHLQYRNISGLPKYYRTTKYYSHRFYYMQLTLQLHVVIKVYRTVLLIYCFIVKKDTSVTSTASTTTGSVQDCPCSSKAKFDQRCGTSSDPHGGLGCNMCGIPKCRACGFEIYPDCPTTSTTTTSTITTSTTTTSTIDTTGIFYFYLLNVDRTIRPLYQ